VLEEYGFATIPGNHTAIERPWQQTVLLNTSVAMDQFWQFGISSLASLSDPNTIFTNETEYSVLADEHAADMLDKAV
jgi:mannan endo-1,4-beta-mannosidase